MNIGRTEVYLHPFLTRALGGDEWSALRSDRITPRSNAAPIGKEAGLAQETLWTF